MLDQAIQESALIGMKQSARFSQRDKASLVHFPGRALWFYVESGRPSIAMDALSALFVDNIAKRYERAGRHPGFFQGFPPRRLFEVCFIPGLTLRNAPGSTAIVSARWMNQ